MNSYQIASFTFLLIFGAASAGFLFQKLLPHHHLSEQSRGAVHLGAGLIATLAALILGLLVSSTKGSYDQAGSLINETCANFAHADRLLANYGTDAEPVRRMLRESLEHARLLVWPEESGAGNQATLNERSSSKMQLENVYNRVSLLKSSNPNQQQIQTDTLHLLNEMIQKRWLLQEVVYGGGISWILLVIPVLFIAFITLVYALYAPRNWTVAVVLFCTSLCIAIAVLLISELSSPLQGLLKLSSKPVHIVLDQMGNG
jgi:hypothetical protein